MSKPTRGRMNQFALQTMNREGLGGPKVMPVTYGRMGNFLFQAAAAIAYAWDHDMEFTLPHVTTNKTHNPLYLQHLAGEFNNEHPIICIQEHRHSYQKLPFEKTWKKSNIILDGYWQTEKYFQHHRDFLLHAFGYDINPDEGKGIVSVHVRRGDYLTLTEKHPPVTKEWYEKAMAEFPDYFFMFHSDDIQWCQDNFGHLDDCDFSLSDEETDLLSMAEAQHSICSASTFSWWGAWLGERPGKRIIMPKLWYQPGHGGLDVSDIVPSRWERL